MEHRQQIFLDFEFTMAEPKEYTANFFPEIIEVGIVSVVNHQIYDTFSTYVVPTFFPTLSNYCKKFLRIKQENIDSGMTFEEMCSYLKMYNDLMPTTVYTWGGSDFSVLRKNCDKNNVKFPFDFKEVDLAQDFKRFFGDPNLTGLQKAIEQYGRKATGTAHRALDDALTAYHIFQLVEKDKRYLIKTKGVTIGERIDVSKLKKRFPLST